MIFPECKDCKYEPSLLDKLDQSLAIGSNYIGFMGFTCTMQQQMKWSASCRYYKRKWWKFWIK